MSEITDRHDIDTHFYIYLQRNSSVWIARFRVDGKWIARTTKERDKMKAINAAIKVKTTCELKAEAGIAIQTKSFRDVAKLAIERMQDEPEGVKGWKSFKDYEQTLNRYHIPFFDRTHITNINREKLLEFDSWRIKEFKRIPAQSTLKNHNAALQRVFDEAVLRDWMKPLQVPSLTVKGGAVATRREHFTTEEVAKIASAFNEFIASGRTKKTREIRKLLYYYFHVAVQTGIRPGTEMENLHWNDVSYNEGHVLITIRKGKTTLHTGTRRVVGHKGVMDIMLDMYEHSVDAHRDDLPDDYNPKIFRLASGEETNELSKNFTQLLKELKLVNSANGKRTLYSLRHTYITTQLLQGLDASLIANQCGTSPEMIHLHYDHMLPQMHANKLVGKENIRLAELIGQYSELE